MRKLKKGGWDGKKRRVALLGWSPNKFVLTSRQCGSSQVARDKRREKDNGPCGLRKDMLRNSDEAGGGVGNKLKKRDK